MSTLQLGIQGNLAVGYITIPLCINFEHLQGHQLSALINNV